MCRMVPLSEVSKDVNVNSSHVLYRVKIFDDQNLNVKARIAPHGNEDSLRIVLRSDCSVYSPVRVRILLSTAALQKWRIMKLDVKAAFP